MILASAAVAFAVEMAIVATLNETRVSATALGLLFLGIFGLPFVGLSLAMLRRHIMVFTAIAHLAVIASVGVLTYLAKHGLCDGQGSLCKAVVYWGFFMYPVGIVCLIALKRSLRSRVVAERPATG
jgi:hypothetical protein